MRWLVLGMLVLFVLSLWSCNKKPSASKKVKYEACDTDKDCVISNKRLNRCCDETYDPRAVHRRELAAIRRWRYDHCKPGTFRCLERSLKMPRHGHRARCRKRRCVTETTSTPDWEKR